MRDDPGEAMPWAVLDRLHQLVPCNCVGFSEVDVQGHVSVLRWSDFYTATELKNDPYYSEYIVHPPVDKYCMLVPLPAGLGRTRRMTFWRSNRDFSERDRLALQLLRPHLHEVYLDAERRRHGIPHVSRREREVLQLVAQGYSNADIALALFISVATVRKHIEHIFDRTGVRTRSAAAALALPHASQLTSPVPHGYPR